MEKISLEHAMKIGALALDFTHESEFEKSYSARVGGSTIYRNFNHKDLFCGIMFTNKESKEGFHLNVMKNGDVFARNFPYYDGVLELVPVYNQRKIVDLVTHSLNINQ